jgi:hypothetical protein
MRVVYNACTVTYSVKCLTSGQPGYCNSMTTKLLAGARNFSIPQNAQTISGVHLASLSMGTEVLSWHESNKGMKLTTHLHAVTMLRMRGAIPLFLLHAFMA